MISDIDGDDDVVDIAIEMTPPVVVGTTTTTTETGVGVGPSHYHHQQQQQLPAMHNSGSAHSRGNHIDEGRLRTTATTAPNTTAATNTQQQHVPVREQRERDMKIVASNESPPLKTIVQDKTRTYIHRFFYPHQHPKEYLSTTATTTSNTTIPDNTTAHNNDTTRRMQESQNTVGVRNSSSPNDLSSENRNINSNGNNRNIETKHTPNDQQPRQQYGHTLSPPPGMNDDPDVKFVTNFWSTYDDVLILSIFTQLGIIFRLAIAIWFTWFDDVFSNDSALFVNLPLNCLSCFMMGLLCSGERLMEIISTRFSPPRTQQSIIQQQEQQQQLRQFYYDDDDDDDDDDDNNNHIYHPNNINNNNNTIQRGRMNSGASSTDGIVRSDNIQRRQRFPTNINNNSNGGILRRRRRTKKERQKNEPRYVSWEPPVCLNEELRDVQLLALERRIRMSKCLVLFPVRKEDVDVMEHYFQEGYKRTTNNDNNNYDSDSVDLSLGDSVNSPISRENYSNSGLVLSPSRPQNTISSNSKTTSSSSHIGQHERTSQGQQQQLSDTPETATSSTTPTSPDTDAAAGTATANVDYIADITDLATNIQDNVQENITRLRRVNLADGWDTGTTAKEMSDDLMLGLRDGFCGAVSSFSSWNSAMVSLMRKGQFTQALVGYMIGLQLPIVAYRFGQHVAVYIFIWRTRQETHKDERRGGYGIRLANIDDDDIEEAAATENNNNNGNNSDEDDDDEKRRKAMEDDMPSLRAVITAVFLLAIVTQCTSIFFYTSPQNQQIALSLLFSPLGVFARWRLGKLNRWKPTFPIGTFTCNILACALSGSIGTYNQVVLVSIVNGFGGTLSSLASFVVEILAGVDPILFRYDGAIYAAVSIGCAMVVGFIFQASVEWADAVVSRTATAISDIPVLDVDATNSTNYTDRYF